MRAAAGVRGSACSCVPQPHRAKRPGGEAAVPRPAVGHQSTANSEGRRDHRASRALWGSAARATRDRRRPLPPHGPRFIAISRLCALYESAGRVAGREARGHPSRGGDGDGAASDLSLSHPGAVGADAVRPTRPHMSGNRPAPAVRRGRRCCCCRRARVSRSREPGRRTRRTRRTLRPQSSAAARARVGTSGTSRQHPGRDMGPRQAAVIGRETWRRLANAWPMMAHIVISTQATADIAVRSVRRGPSMQRHGISAGMVASRGPLLCRLTHRLQRRRRRRRRRVDCRRRVAAVPDGAPGTGAGATRADEGRQGAGARHGGRRKPGTSRGP